MRIALLLLFAACSSAPKDDTVPQDLELDDSPWQAREPRPEAPAPPDAGPATREQLEVKVVSEPSEPSARIDLAVRDADVHNVLRMIATAANVGIVVSDDIQGTLTLDVDNVTWRQAIDVIAHLENLVVTEVDGVVLVKKAP